MVKTEVLACHVAIKSSHNAGFHGKNPLLTDTVNTHSCSSASSSSSIPVCTLTPGLRTGTGSERKCLKSCWLAPGSGAVPLCLQIQHHFQFVALVFCHDTAEFFFFNIYIYKYSIGLKQINKPSHQAYMCIQG